MAIFESNPGLHDAETTMQGRLETKHPLTSKQDKVAGRACLFCTARPDEGEGGRREGEGGGRAETEITQTN